MSNYDIFTRPVLGGQKNPEVAQALEWLSKMRDKTMLDMDVLSYPATTLMCAYAKSSMRPLLYIPVQQVYMMDGMGVSPTASPLEVAAGLEQVVKSVHWESFKQGLGEIYAPIVDEGLQGVMKRHGFATMDYEVPQQTEDEQVTETAQVTMPFLRMKVFK